MWECRVPASTLLRRAGTTRASRLLLRSLAFSAKTSRKFFFIRTENLGILPVLKTSLSKGSAMDGSSILPIFLSKRYSKTLTDLGKFRMVPADDLARLGYRGDRSRMESDLHSLSRQGLIEQRSIEGHQSYSKQVFTLTKEGHKLLSRPNLIPGRQAIYHGFAKPKEARHDADLYRLYHKVAREINDSGGKVRRVVLDYELKRELYRKLSRVPPEKNLAYERIRIASEYDLKVVNDKIPVPDLRVEYEDECRDLHRLDLEIATRDYRPQGLAEKAKAGFHLFARQQDHPKLRRVLDTQEITAKIFAL